MQKSPSKLADSSTVGTIIPIAYTNAGIDYGRQIEKKSAALENQAVQRPLVSQQQKLRQHGPPKAQTPANAPPDGSQARMASLTFARHRFFCRKIPHTNLLFTPHRCTDKMNSLIIWLSGPSVADNRLPAADNFLIRYGKNKALRHYLT